MTKPKNGISTLRKQHLRFIAAHSHNKDIHESSNMLSNIDKMKKMQTMFEDKVTKSNVLFLDLDGTFVTYSQNKKKGLFVRPYTATFLKRLKPHFDFIVYSAAQAPHAKKVVETHFKKYVNIIYDNRYLFNGKKRYSAIKGLQKYWGIDDNINSVDINDREKVIEISRWWRRRTDNELKKICEKLLQMINSEDKKEEKKGRSY